MTVEAHKLLRVRRDGSLGPLFIDKRLRIPVGRWLVAKPKRTKGYAFRPGWHAVSDRRTVKHLRQGGDRLWFLVELRGARAEVRPRGQGTWYVARKMRVVRALPY